MKIIFKYERGGYVLILETKSCALPDLVCHKTVL